MAGENQPKHDAEHRELLKAAETIQTHQSGIVLTGRIVNGKVELDQATLDAISRKFAGSNRSFVAVNAPFDPQNCSI